MNQNWISVQFTGDQQEAWDWVAENFEVGDYFRVKWSRIVEFRRPEDAMLFILRWK
jgi:hypothetical protein